MQRLVEPILTAFVGTGPLSLVFAKKISVVSQPQFMIDNLVSTIEKLISCRQIRIALSLFEALELFCVL